MQSIKQQVSTQLSQLQQANQSLHELTIDLTLLDVISRMTLDVSQAVDALLEQNEAMSSDEFIASLGQSESIEILDEVVDTDAISEVENQFFSAIDDMDDSVMGGFLAELIEKIEVRYTDLVETIHELNALLSTVE